MRSLILFIFFICSTSVLSNIPDILKFQSYELKKFEVSLRVNCLESGTRSSTGKKFKNFRFWNIGRIESYLGDVNYDNLIYIMPENKTTLILRENGDVFYPAKEGHVFVGQLEETPEEADLCKVENGYVRNFNYSTNLIFNENYEVRLDVEKVEKECWSGGYGDDGLQFSGDSVQKSVSSIYLIDQNNKERRFPHSSVNFQLESWGVKHIAFSLQTHSV